MLLAVVVNKEDANVVIVGDLLQSRQISIVLGIGIDSGRNIVPDHLQRIDE